MTPRGCAVLQLTACQLSRWLRGSGLVTAGEAEGKGLPDGFATTQWSLVLAAQGAASPIEALERLCRVYWQPVFVYVRRCGFEHADAEDLAQSFFADILQRDWLNYADPDRGSFRGFLHASVRRFVRQYRRAEAAEKRGGHLTRVDLEGEAGARGGLADERADLEPDRAFDREWAHTVLHRALERLALEQPDERRRQLFEACRPFLLHPAAAGEYEAIAHRFEVARGTVAVTVHRLGKRYRELVRAEVSETVSRPAEVESELRHLLQAVSDGA